MGDFQFLDDQELWAQAADALGDAASDECDEEPEAKKAPLLKQEVPTAAACAAAPASGLLPEAASWQALVEAQNVFIAQLMAERWGATNTVEGPEQDRGLAICEATDWPAVPRVPKSRAPRPGSAGA